MDYKENFTFTKQERRGILVFFILTIATIIAFSYWPSKTNLPGDFDVSAYYMPEDSIINDAKSKNYDYDNDNDFFYEGSST